MRTERKPDRVLDRIDRKILQQLQNNARSQMKELADQVGLTSAPCIERVRQLERNKVITAYRAQIDPAALGLPLLVFLQISLADRSGDRVKQFQREILKIDNVLECYWVSGEYDYLIKARLRDMDDYRVLLSNILQRVPGAQQAKSAVVIEEIKAYQGLPIPL